MIDLENDDPQGIEQMLEYLYTLQVPQLAHVSHARSAYIIADRYGLQALKDSCCEVLCAKLQQDCLIFDWTPSDDKAELLSIVSEIWSWKFSDTLKFHEAILRGFTASASTTLADKHFQDFMWEHRDFGIVFMQTALQNRGRVPTHGTEQVQPTLRVDTRSLSARNRGRGRG